MKALVKIASGIELQDLPEPAIQSEDQVKIRITRAALCRTDLYVADGSIKVSPLTILGHEAAGIIEESGSAACPHQPGDRVVIDPLITCGHCSGCTSANRHLCESSTFLGIDTHGAFAEYIVLSANQVHQIPDNLDFDQAIYAEPLAATRAVLQNLKKSSEPILVYGNGRIAELTAHVLRSAGFCPTLEPSERNYKMVIEAAESVEGISQALKFVQPGGKLIVKSRHPDDLSLPLLDLVQKRLNLESVYYSPFEEALNDLKQQRDFISTLLGNHWKLEDYEQAFAEAKASEARKTLFTFG